MDIEYLLLLQNFREGIGAFLKGFLSFITTIAVDYYVLIPAFIIFWVADKRKGRRILLSMGASLLFGALLKTIFCVYRPWVRDSRIKPLDEALPGATGYSFPSGHSFSAAGFYGAVAEAYKKYKKVVIFCVTMILLTMFSRNYVGVHTPQDVVVGASVGVLSAYLVTKLMDYMEAHPEKEWMVLAGTVAVLAIVLPFIYFKQYPIDYVDGVLLVDPKKMTVDGFKDPGRFFGIVLGWYLEKRFVNFDTDAELNVKVERCVFGALLTVFYWTAVVNPLGKFIGVGVVHFVLHASIPLLMMVIYPMTFEKSKQ